MSIVKVALTGSIACGKTTVGNLFAKLGIQIIDLDIIAKEVLTKNSKCLELLVNSFGKQILTNDNNLDRVVLKKLLFANSSNKKIIDTITHPAIIAKMNVKINNLQKQNITIVLVVVPLLFASNIQDIFDKIIVINCNKNIQKQQLINRDKLDSVNADKILASQISNEKQQQLARDFNAYIINNNSDIAELEPQVLTIYQQLLR